MQKWAMTRFIDITEDKAHDVTEDWNSPYSRGSAHTGETGWSGVRLNQTWWPVMETRQRLREPEAWHLVMRIVAPGLAARPGESATMEEAGQESTWDTHARQENEIKKKRVTEWTSSVIQADHGMTDSYQLIRNSSHYQLIKTEVHPYTHLL